MNNIVYFSLKSNFRKILLTESVITFFIISVTIYNNLSLYFLLFIPFSILLNYLFLQGVDYNVDVNYDTLRVYPAFSSSKNEKIFFYNEIESISFDIRPKSATNQRMVVLLKNKESYLFKFFGVMEVKATYFGLYLKKREITFKLNS